LTVKSEPHCAKCGWHGPKRELKRKDVNIEVQEQSSHPRQAFFRSLPSHRVEYRCPQCNDLMASDLKFLQSYFDQETFEDEDGQK
jgi:hypothetical protein